MDWQSRSQRRLVWEPEMGFQTLAFCSLLIHKPLLLPYPSSALRNTSWVVLIIQCVLNINVNIEAEKNLPLIYCNYTLWATCLVCKCHCNTSPYNNTLILKYNCYFVSLCQILFQIFQSKYSHFIYSLLERISLYFFISLQLSASFWLRFRINLGPLASPK